MKKLFLFGLFCLLFSLQSFSQNSLLLRQPAINKDGSLIAFSFQGDIWTVPIGGGKAARLTIHEAYESNPTFSPNGNQIAFSGGRFGNNDLFVMPAEGGLPNRLTYHSGADNIASWTVKDKILFSTNREFRQLERPSEVYSISPNGGTESRFLDAVGHDPALSPDGRFLVFVRGDLNPVARQEYTGSSNRDLWLYDIKNKSFNKLPGFETNDVFPQWGGNNSIYFLSSVDGSYNIYRLKIDGNGKSQGKPEKLSNYKDESIRAFGISADGTSLVFEKDMNIYTMKTSGGSAQKISIQINADERLDASELKTLSTGATEYAVSPNGKLLSYSIRGEIFVKEADKEKTRSINVSNHAFRDLEPNWLNDSTLLFTSDRANGNFDIYLLRSADSTQKNIFKTLKHELIQITKTQGSETAIAIANDGKKIAYVEEEVP